MKREERTIVNHMKKYHVEGLLNVEVKLSYTEEGKQAMHEVLTIEKGLFAVRVCPSFSTFENVVLYIPAHTAEQKKQRQQQETMKFVDVLASLPTSDYTWNGYKRPEEQPEEQPEKQQEKQPEEQPEKRKGYDFKRMFHIINDAITNDVFSFHAPRDNSKLKGIPAWNLAPGKTCSAAACAHCMKEGCYAVKNMCCHGYNMEKNNCMRAWTENTVLAMLHMDTLETMLDNWLTKKRPALFRVHSSGDFFSVAYADMWKRLAAKHPETRFLAFTKQFDIVRQVSFYDVENFELVLSGWTGISIPADLLKHYRAAWCNDGQETRIPADAIHCPGNCNTCRACWFLSRIGKDSYFDKH